MNTAPIVAGNHLFFFAEGVAYTSPSSGTCARESKPGASDTGWINLGSVSDLSIELTSDDKEVYKATPGVRRLYDVIQTKRAVVVKATLEELGPTAFELAFGTSRLTSASTQYNPLEGSVKKGWLKVQQYDQTDTIFNTVDLFVHLKAGGGTSFGDDIVKVAIEARTLHSTLNTGTLVAS